jgi:hypothetical protein
VAFAVETKQRRRREWSALIGGILAIGLLLGIGAAVMVDRLRPPPTVVLGETAIAPSGAAGTPTAMIVGGAQSIGGPPARPETTVSPSGTPAVAPPPRPASAGASVPEATKADGAPVVPPTPTLNLAPAPIVIATPKPIQAVLAPIPPAPLPSPTRAPTPIQPAPAIPSPTPTQPLGALPQATPPPTAAP